MAKKFKIYKVATMYGVSRPSLLYCHHITLLKQTFVEAKGYRFYTFRNMEKLELIISKITNDLDANGYELLSGGYLIPLVDAWSTISENDY